MAMIKEEDCPEGLPGWLATFGDLMSLLLTFFVLLLSFSTMSVVNFQHAMGALQGALGVLSGEPQLSLPIRQSMPKTEGNLSQAEMMNKAGSELEHAIEEAGLQGDVHLEEVEDHGEDPRETEFVSRSGAQNSSKYDLWSHGLSGHTDEATIEATISNQWVLSGAEEPSTY